MAAEARHRAPAEARLLEVVLEQLPVGVVVAEAPSGRMTYASRQTARILGRPLDAAEREGLAALGLRRPDGTPVPAADTPLARALRGETVSGELYELAPRDGPLRLISVSSQPVEDEDGEIVAAVSVLDDVTARMRSARAEREFVLNAAHELRTPLAAILSAVEVLQGGAKELPEERDLFLGHVERETRRLSRIATALLTLARAQTRAERPRVEIVALRPLLEEIASGLRPTAGVGLAVDCPDDLAALTNRDLCEQAVVNLAANAVRYTARGSICLSGRAEAQQAVVEVRDTGPGLDAEAQALATRPFVRGSGDGEGFGLGLSIVRQAVEAIDAKLELESASGAGTTARIRLRLARLVKS